MNRVARAVGFAVASSNIWTYQILVPSEFCILHKVCFSSSGCFKFEVVVEDQVVLTYLIALKIGI